MSGLFYTGRRLLGFARPQWLSTQTKRSIAAAVLTTSIGMSHAIAPCNLPSAWVNNVDYNNLSASRSNAGVVCLNSFSGAVNNLTDSNLTNTTGFNTTGLGCSVTYAVRDPDVADTHPAGYYAGFKISPANLLSAGVAATVRIETYRSGSLLESKTVINATTGIDSSMLDSDGLATIGFVTTQSFDEVRVRYTTLTGALFSGTVYHAVIERYCAGAATACNTETPLNQISYPAVIDQNLTGVTSLAGATCVGCSISNINRIISTDTADFAEVNLLAGINTVASIAVRNQLSSYPAGTLAGFSISRPTLLDAELLSGVVINTYLQGVLQESSTGNQLLVANSGLLTEQTARRVGFVATQPFDTVQLQIASLAGVASTTRVYHALLQRFCAGPTPACNVPTLIQPTDYPVLVNSVRTGIGSGVCVGCAVLNADNILSNNSSDAAVIRLTAGVLATGSIAVKDMLTDYPAGTFAGFIIENSNLIGANLLSGIRIRTYRDNVLQEVVDVNNGALLSVDAPLLTGNSNRRQVGFITTAPFDEVQLEMTNLLGLLNETLVYHTLVQSFCSGPSPTCGVYTALQQPLYPAVINQVLSRVGGAVCALCSIQNTPFLVDDNPNNYAEINLVAGLLSTGSIAVRDAVTDYPAGTFAGFDVFNASIVGLDLLQGASITTYRNGIEQETRSGALLALELLTASRQVIGFNATQPFDEIRLTMQNLASVNVGTTRVYRALVRPPEVGSEAGGAIGLGVCPALRDYSDAPASFGVASHTASAGIFLGTLAPDTESYPLNSSNGFTDFSGDDLTGTADEGDWTLAPLTPSDTNYSLNVACTGLGTVAGWIDFNQNGEFAADERSSALCSGGSAALSWSNISPQAGLTAARFRMAFDAAEVLLPTGTASSGEVNDTQILVSSSTQVTISGRVFTDNSGTTGLAANAYNGIQDDPSEVGIAGSRVEITDCDALVLATTQTDAAGDYLFSLDPSSLSQPNFCIVQHNLDHMTSVSGSAGYQHISDRIVLANTGATEYSDQRFGDVKMTLALVANGQKTIVASGVADYPHTMTSQAVLTPDSLNLTTNATPTDAGWSQVTYLDANCNGQIDPAESPVDQLSQLTPISKICLVLRVQAPAAASVGMQQVTTLSSTYQATIQDGTVLTGVSNSVTDTTLLGTASLQMHKSVRRVSNCSASAVGLEPFGLQNQAQNGDFLQYEIAYTNASSRNISQLKVRDTVTDIIRFESMECTNTPVDAQCAIETQPSVGGQGAISWLISGVLKPAAQGSVRFCVAVVPLLEAGLR